VKSKPVTVPDDLAAALAANPQARSAFESMPPSHRREHVKYIDEAVKPETRQRRIAATIATLIGQRPSDRKM
jgi:uncharacterized protein YdeI (YjbR/CyaY-like superfamily)